VKGSIRHKTFREALEYLELENRFQAEDAIKSIIEHYFTERLHSALGFLRPADYYRGDPPRLHESRRHKLAQARLPRMNLPLARSEKTSGEVLAQSKTAAVSTTESSFS